MLSCTEAAWVCQGNPAWPHGKVSTGERTTGRQEMVLTKGWELSKVLGMPAVVVKCRGDVSFCSAL